MRPSLSLGASTIGLVFLLNAACADAFWRLLCRGSVGLARMDPIVNPGDVSDHVHTIKGGSAFSPHSGSAGLVNSKCSSCDVKEDRSAYWTPALYFINSDDGTVEVVPEKPPHKSYYFLNDGLTSEGKQQKIEAFPRGFQMIAGSTSNRNSSLPNPEPNSLGPWVDDSQELRAQRALGFNCLNYKNNLPEPTLGRHFMPDKSFLDANCPDGIRLELQFPSCWNGDPDSKDHKKHLAYPDGVMVGNCPKGYDRRLVSLLYETIVATDHYNNKNGKFVFSNGDPTGYGYHGDFLEGWEAGVLQKAIDTCTNLSGNQEDCPVFSFDDHPTECLLESPLPAVISKENVCGPMQGLPNGIKVQGGPELAQPHTPNPASYLPPAAQSVSALPSSSTQAVPVVPTVAVSSASHQPTHTPGAQSIELKNKIAQVSSTSTTLSSSEKYVESTSTTLLTSSKPAPPATTHPAELPDAFPPVALAADRIITTQTYNSGREAYERVVVLKEVTVTATAGAGLAKKASMPKPVELHVHKGHEHKHHVAHGIDGRRIRL